MRQRLPDRGPVDYQVERSNETWVDHRLRTLVTGAAIAWLRPSSVLDPACGDGSIVEAAERLHHIAYATLADISGPSIAQLTKSRSVPGASLVMDAVAAIEDSKYVDVVVLTEFLEHVEDPDAVLRLAKTKARYLVASSPEMRPGQFDTNPEHLWMFDREGYRDMLTEAGWRVQQYTYLNFPTVYDFGIWVCS